MNRRNIKTLKLCQQNIKKKNLLTKINQLSTSYKSTS